MKQTCTGGKILREYKGNTIRYISDIMKEFWLQIKEKQLEKCVDAFIDHGSFKSENSRLYFEKVQELEFDIAVHAFKFFTGGNLTRVDFGTVREDQLKVSKENEIKLLIESKTVASLLIETSLKLDCSFAQVRKLLNEGAILYIGSDFNSGSTLKDDLLPQLATFKTFEKLRNTEVFISIISCSAKALNLAHQMDLAKGNLKALILFKMVSYANILYHQGQLKSS
ncbi:amidohydrolase family protein [Gelidibacter pelagius]|uniref:imidazolonepropionase n=1 Tax=Gelidibacter pelagius TaxID=2819985 RepID=A0ABS3SWB0_9FLAO|nr:hypothetical protein [Gelidibacter pelagius]MBO3099736.1 hypothetical protein [Gelidibacter pelagius]